MCTKVGTNLVCISEMVMWRIVWALCKPIYGCLCSPENGHFRANVCSPEKSAKRSSNTLVPLVYFFAKQTLTIMFLPNYMHITVKKQTLKKDKQSYQTLWSYAYEISMPYQFPKHFSNLNSMYQNLRNFINCNSKYDFQKECHPIVNLLILFFKLWLWTRKFCKKNKKKMNPYFCKDSIAVLHKSGFDKKIQ